MAPKPITSPTAPVTDSAGRATQSWFEYFKSIDSALRTLLADFDVLSGESSTFLTTAGGQTITGGFLSTEYDNGTPTNGASITINPINGLKQKITNNVAGFSILATAQSGDVELRIINGATAGTITFSGFHKQHAGGDSLTTTNAHQFIAFIYGYGAAGADYLVRKRQ
jgi:hypothetical protein